MERSRRVAPIAHHCDCASFRPLRVHNAQQVVREQYNLALPIAERALARAERTANQSEAWRFRLLKADIVIGQRQSAKTLALLDSYGNTPNGSEWAE